MKTSLSELIQKILVAIQSSDIGKRIASGAFWSIAGSVVSKFIVLLSGIVCAHVLTKQEYGEVGLIRSTISMFVVFGSAGLGLTASKYISQYRKDSPERIPSIFLLTNGFAWVSGAVMAVAILLLAPYISAELLHAEHLTNTIRVGAFLLFVTILNGAQNGVISGFEDFRAVAINTFIGSLCESVFMVLGAYLYGVLGAIIGYGVGYISLYIANQISIKRIFKKISIAISRNSFNKDDIALLFTFSLPAMLSSIVVTPTYWIIKTLLVNNTSFEELAMYEVADQWKTICLFIPNALSSILLPILSSLHNENGNQFWKVLKINLYLNGSVSLFIAVLLMALSPFILKLYGSSYGGGELVMALLALSSFFSAISNVVGLSISSRAKMWTGFLFNSIWAILVISFSWYFEKRGMGAAGIALALTLSYFFHTIYQFIYLRIIVKHA